MASQALEAVLSPAKTLPYNPHRLNGGMKLAPALPTLKTMPAPSWPTIATVTATPGKTPCRAFLRQRVEDCAPPGCAAVIAARRKGLPPSAYGPAA